MRIPIYNRFIAGNNMRQVIEKAKAIKFKPIYDFAGEHTNNYSKVVNEICYLDNQVRNSKIALKLSGLGLMTNEDICAKSLDIILHNSHNNNQFLIDAEEVAIQQSIRNITADYMLKYNVNYQRIFSTIQMYRKDGMEQMLKEIQLCNDNRRWYGVKVVRGAYLQQDRKTGLLHENIEGTHEEYRNVLKYALELSGGKEKFIFATHNRDNLDAIIKFGWKNTNIESAQLLGMSDTWGEKLLKKGIGTYKYLPYGSIKQCLPYFIRRLWENYDILKYL